MTIVGFFELVVVTAVVRSSGFLQDDYLFFAQARQQGLTFHSVTLSRFGSLIPGFSLVDTAMAAMHPISRWPLVLVTISLYAIIVLLFYVLLELLFGACPAIVALTAVATTSSLLAVALAWWTPSINLLPAVAAGLLALQGLIRHAITRRRRHLVIAAISFAVGVAFYDASMELLLVLVLFTVLYLADPHDWRSVGRALRSRTILWIGCAIPIALNLGWRGLHPTDYALLPPAGIGKYLRFMGAGWAQGFAPAPLGITTTAWEAVVLGQAFVFGVVLFSIFRRRTAWKAWVWFGTSFLATDALVAFGRGSLKTAFAWNAIYWLSLGFQFWIAVALAYLPSAVTIDGRLVLTPLRSRGRHSIRKDHSRRNRVIGAAAMLGLCCLGLHAIWDTPARAMGSANTSYLANLRASWQQVSHADPTAFIWDVPAPWFVLSSDFAPYNELSTTVGLVVPGLRFDAPSGNGYLLGSDGRLVPASVRAVSALAPFAGPLATDPARDCLQSGTRTELALPLTAILPKGQWITSIRYLTTTPSTVFLGDQSLSLPKGAGTMLLPAGTTGPTDEIVLQIPPRTPLCLQLTVEEPMPSGSTEG